MVFTALVFTALRDLLRERYIPTGPHQILAEGQVPHLVPRTP